MGQEGRKKIAVLGGGIASLTTVAELTCDPDWQSRYDITFYQLGWLLGGKGASGRAQDNYNRIEEHGYHMWFGFYDNAFRLIRHIYKENARSLDIPLATWSEAFKPVNYWVTAEKVNGEYENWPLEFPPNSLTPGTHLDTLFLLQAVRALRWFFKLLKSLHQTASFSVDDEELTVYRLLRADMRGIAKGVLARWLYVFLGWLNRKGDSREHRDRMLESPQNFLERLQVAIERAVVKDRIARRTWILTDFIGANFRGALFDGVLFKNRFDMINDWDYREWLKRHGATEFTLQSPLVQGFYALVFSGTFYSFEAGTALRATLELLLNFKGSVYWKMEAGMGDVVFAPIYEVLKKRGVKFRFFHRVKHIKSAADPTRIESITIGRQVTIKPSTHCPLYAEYDPLINVRGLPCWPAAPLYEQIVEGGELQEKKINLESSWSTWQDVDTVTLQVGQDFDLAVLGIPISALPDICPEIIETRPEWQAMIKHVKGIPTIGVQLWMRPDIAGLGSTLWRNEICLVSTYVEPLSTWADKSDLLIRESWPDAHVPNNIAYLTGPMLPQFHIEPFSEVCFPSHARNHVKEYAEKFLKSNARYLWPHWVDPNDKQPRWELLVDPKGRVGEDRLDAQYFRANIDPSEHYVLTVKGSSKFRLRADESGFDNLVLTGDWTKNPLNVGCIEAAVMSGIFAAQTILKQPLEIERDPVGPASFLTRYKKGKKS